MNRSIVYMPYLTRTLALAAMLAAPSSACSAPRFVDPAEIDFAVETFTGITAGKIGGAVRPVDARLRLEHCSRPLTAMWHGNRQRTVRVACEGTSAWHLFIPIRTASPPAKPQQIIRRGDTVTIAVEGQGFTVRRPGEAQQAGAVGEWIAVKTSRKAEPVNAKIVRPGLVVIPL